ncbi:MAG: sulfotransferase domain-containing protein [Gammaproteobacteria bacterium]|nr:MAG: sulfotransferase domain-containing protein [Gammaproteobacteria bacterium]
MSHNNKRASSLPELQELLGRIFTKEEVGRGLGLQLRSTDIVITPFGKSGTTWLQQIVHTLRTRGDMDFDDISRVVPWIESSPALGLDLDAEQRANPRAFKSHLEYEPVPKGGKYINSVRNPGDALYSMYRFMEGWFLEPGAVSVDEFARERFIKSGDYWRHLKSWWARRQQPNVLFMAYEHMQQDLEGTIVRVARFIDIPLDDDLLKITLQHASFAFMLEHKDRFDDALMRRLSETRCKLPSGSDSAKVREGTVGSRKALSAETLAELDKVWQQEIEASLGYKDYASLIATLA